MTVFYYTSVAYLDIAIEVIRVLKETVDLHVVIEIAPESMRSNILEVDSLEGLPVIAAPERVLTATSLAAFQSYFTGAAVHFFVQHNRRTFSWETYRECRVLAKHIQQVRPDSIHFDTAKARALGLLPLLYQQYRNRVFITIHDPVPHTGEFNWRNMLVQKGFYPLAAGFLFYSTFSRSLFARHYGRYAGQTTVLGMHRYHFYRNYITSLPTQRDTIVFFGRISPYKGIDILLGAIPLVVQQYPEARFVIAGGGGAGYQLPAELVEACGANLELRLRHIGNEELVKLVAAARFVVCPYRDATQSGVLMTAFACHTGVIASAVGAFPEYIQEGVNGSLYAPNTPVELAAAICRSLASGIYADWTSNLARETANGWKEEADRITGFYHKQLHAQ